MTDERVKAASLLKAVLNGEISAQEAIARWPAVTEETETVVEGSYEQLFHYASDEDIHIREPLYEQRQKQNIQLCIDKLLS